MGTHLNTQLMGVSELLAEKLRYKTQYERSPKEVAIALRYQADTTEAAVENGRWYLTEEGFEHIEWLGDVMTLLLEESYKRQGVTRLVVREPRCSILQKVLRWTGRIG